MRMRLALVGALLGLGLGATAQSMPSIDQKKPKLAKAYLASVNVVSIEGAWEADNPTEKNNPVFHVTRIECHRSGGRDMVATASFCVIADAIPIVGTINVNIHWWKVVEWNQTEIIAVDDSALCLTSQITIDLTSKTASWANIKKASAIVSCKNPDRRTFYLRDNIDYHLAHFADKPN